MASSIMKYLGYRAFAPTKGDSMAVRALPSSWYSSKSMFELERRSIFSKQWMLITHISRLSQAGSWLKYDIAGFEFILCRDKQGKINGFHNVCRHRAFPVVTEEKGLSKIFSCKYHGWSYGLDGKLTKAPEYQELDEFHKQANGLLNIHVHIDHNGFIWVNLDAKEYPEVAWGERYSGVDTQERFKQFNFEEYVFDHAWNQDGPYNWKILADNYNECYHCATTHPDIPTVADLKSYSVKTNNNFILHDGATTDEQRRKGLTVASTYFLPNASLNISPHFFFIQRFVAISPTMSSMRYEVFRNRNSSEEDFQFINQIYKRIMSEDKYLCELTQRNLEAGVFVNGEMHPRLEKGPLYFQSFIRDTVTTHHKCEMAAKQEIWPARQHLPSNAVISEMDISFCTGLDCETRNKGLLW